MNSSRVIFTLIMLTVIIVQPVSAQKKLNVVATLPDLAFIASEIGGEHVKTFSIATGYQNPHFVDPKPSYIVKLSRADIFVTIGLDLEAGWVPALLNSARNEKIVKGGRGYVDASRNVPLLEVPQSLSREQGDIHAYGNPHYWMDPSNGRIMAQNVYEALVDSRPELAPEFSANLAQFNDELDARIEDWRERLQPFRGTKVIAYHNQWPYFEKHFGFEIVDFLEPKPGIPPTPSQLAKIIGLMNAQDIRTIIIAPYYRKDSAELVARRTNGRVLELASAVGAYKGIQTYWDMFDYNVDLLIEAFRASAP